MMHPQIHHGVGRGDQEGTPPPPHPPRGGQDLPGLFPETPVAAPVTGRGVPGWGVELDQPPDSLCTPPRAGHHCDPGEG